LAVVCALAGMAASSTPARVRAIIWCMRSPSYRI
jgi:hypothetical protein